MKSLFSKFLLILVASLLTTFFLISCSSDDDPVTPDPPQLIQLSGTVGASGGTLTSTDGKLSLTFPPGAVTAETDITVTEIAADEASAIFDGLVIEKAFNVEPLGLEFAEDVEISLTLDLEPPAVKKSAVETQQVMIETRFLAIADNTLEQPIFLDTEIEVDSNRIFRGAFRELNTLILAALGTPALWVQNQLTVGSQVVENISFESTLTMVVSNLLLMDTSPRFYYSANTFTFELEDGDTMTPDSETTESDGSITRTYDVQTTATEDGDLHLAFAVYMLMKPEREAFADLDLPLSVEMPDIGIYYNIGPLEIAVAEENPGTDNLPLGVYSTNLQMSDGLSVLRGYIDWELDDTVSISHADGMHFLDLAGTPALQVVNDDFDANGDQHYGTLIMEIGFKSDKAAGYKILLFGPNGGSVSSWVPENHSFGMQQLFAFGQNLTDALAYDNNHQSSGYCFVNNTYSTVQLMEYDSGSGFFQGAGSVSNFPDATGNAVSAYVRAGESMLVAVDGTPGRLYLQELSSLLDASTYIDDLGNSPRRIRSMGEVAVISNFASGTLTVVSWSQADEVAVTATVAVGDGPVGIDLLELAGGNIAIASTGFNDDTYWVTVVSPSGSLVSNTEHLLPAGISGAAHAAWAHDENNRILISGNTTGNLAVVGSGL